MIKKIILSIIVILISLPCYAVEFDGLTEMETRITRQPTNTYTPATLEDSSNNYNWQSESMCFSDATTGKEVWRLSSPSNTSNGQQDISWPTTSADGKYVTWKAHRQTNAHSSSYWEGYGNWFMARTDGTVLRPLVNTPARSAVRYTYFSWSPVEPDVYYVQGNDWVPGELNLDEETIFKVTVTDTTESYEAYITSMPTLDSASYKSKKGFASDGSQMIWVGTVGGIKTLVPVTILPEASKGILASYPITRDWDDYWGRIDAYNGTFHDQHLTGTGSNIWFHIMLEGSPSPSSWMRIKLTGTDADGGPIANDDILPPYDWGGELDYTNTIVTNGKVEGDCDYPYRDPNCCDNDPATDCPNYFSHYTVDRWGAYIAYANTGGSSVGVGIWDVENRVHKIEQFTSTVGATHPDWHAWSDWSVCANVGSGTVYGDGAITTQNVNDVDSLKILVYPHTASPTATVSNYERLARPTQSPDGTKVNYHSSWMNADINIPDFFYVVAYYPYAPEITNTSATAGTATIRFDWQNTLADANPRTYTTRGWPSETTDDRPIPRETDKYRLWRSADKVTWTPISTINANHFTRFDFADGGFKTGQDSYWEITDTPGNGTFYYAVTSIENSGLESRSLSNIFSITVSAGSGTGSQDTVYPTDPGADASFITTYDSDLHRYYNIYYGNGVTPTATVAYKVASVVDVNSWIDWNAAQNANGQYIVTAVDTMGNESATLDTTSVYQQAPATAAGQYTVTWTDTLDTNPVVTLQADKQATSPTTYTGTFTVETGRTASTVVSSNGFTVTCDDGDCTDEETEAFTVSGVTVPITDVITVTDSSAETGNDSIILTLPTPATSVGTINGTVNGNFR